MMYKPYMLLMYMLQQSIQFSSSSKDWVLNKDDYMLKKTYPQMTDSDIVKRQLKISLPQTLPGSLE